MHVTLVTLKSPESAVEGEEVFEKSQVPGQVSTTLAMKSSDILAAASGKMVAMYVLEVRVWKPRSA